MKIKIIAINKKVLERGDFRVIADALNYMYHRVKKHDKCRFTRLDELQRLRREMGLIRKSEK